MFALPGNLRFPLVIKYSHDITARQLFKYQIFGGKARKSTSLQIIIRTERKGVLSAGRTKTRQNIINLDLLLYMEKRAMLSVLLDFAWESTSRPVPFLFFVISNRGR
jgi:hypothetical protein